MVSQGDVGCRSGIRVANCFQFSSVQQIRAGRAREGWLFPTVWRFSQRESALWDYRSTPTTTYTHTHTHTHTHIVKPEAPETSPCLGGPKTLSLELPGTRVQCNRVPLCVTRVPWAQRQYFLRPVLWPVLRPIALSPLPRIGICSIRVSSAPWSSAGRGLVSFERPP